MESHSIVFVLVKLSRSSKTVDKEEQFLKNSNKDLCRGWPTKRKASSAEATEKIQRNRDAYCHLPNESSAGEE